MRAIIQDFAEPLDPHLQQRVVGNGALEFTGASLRFGGRRMEARRYSNAQLDDYFGLPRRRFPWQPPLQMTVRARFSHPAGRGESGLRGTAGFGFWNDPFLMTGVRVPALPRVAWFFYASPPSDMKLDLGVPGYGWKAAAVDALRPVALPLALLAPPLILAMNHRWLYHKLWPPIQRALRIAEAEIEVDMTGWHTYALHWGLDRAQFHVDGGALLDAPSPRGPLGFVMWLDNQYLVATPWGRLRWGVLDRPGSQWMEVERLSIEPGEGVE